MRFSRGSVAGIATLGFAIVLSCSSNDSTGPALDPNGVAYSFVVVGCNRVAAPESLGVVSTANVQELTRTFADIAALNPKPNFLFFAGDLVFGYTNDSTALDRELKGWIALYQASPLPNSGVELVAIPGNHETDNLAKVAYGPGERTWLRDMAPYISRGGNGPTAGGADGLATDQSKLTYSFDFKDAHFVALNTDPVGKDWHVPTAWVTSDLAAAKSRGVKHIFAIGHKPAYPYPTVPTDGLSFDLRRAMPSGARSPAIRSKRCSRRTITCTTAFSQPGRHGWSSPATVAHRSTPPPTRPFRHGQLLRLHAGDGHEQRSGVLEELWPRCARRRLRHGTHGRDDAARLDRDHLEVATKSMRWIRWSVVVIACGIASSIAAVHAMRTQPRSRPGADVRQLVLSDADLSTPRSRR